MTQDIKIKAPKKRKNASLEKRKARAGWIFVLPFVIGFVLFCKADKLSRAHMQTGE